MKVKVPISALLLNYLACMFAIASTLLGRYLAIPEARRCSVEDAMAIGIEVTAEEAKERGLKVVQTDGSRVDYVAL